MVLNNKGTQPFFQSEKSLPEKVCLNSDLKMSMNELVKGKNKTIVFWGKKNLGKSLGTEPEFKRASMSESQEGSV